MTRPSPFSLRNWTLWAEWRGGSSYADIARTSGLSYSHVYSVVQKMRRLLRHPYRRALLGRPASSVIDVDLDGNITQASWDGATDGWAEAVK